MIAALSTQEAVGFTAVVVLGALFGGVAVPAGLLAGLSPAATWIAACLGAISATWLLLLGGGAIRDRLIDRFDYCEKRDIFAPGGMNEVFRPSATCCWMVRSSSARSMRRNTGRPWGSPCGFSVVKS